MIIEYFPASLENLHAMIDFIRAHGTRKGLSHKTIEQVILAAEEVIVNIIHYGYPATYGRIGISCEDSDLPGIQVTFLDDGIPFNPLEGSHPSPLSHSTNLKKVKSSYGGFGLFLVSELMDKISYRRECGRNILQVVKYADL